MEAPNAGPLAGYKLASRLGIGSHGEVYRAVQASTGQTVAVKILRIRSTPHAPPREVQIERFRREMTACAALQHPHIVRAVDAGTTRDGRLFSVFEYVPGPTLRSVLQEHRALSISRLREFLLQTLDALVCAHGRGIIHRDFKPENIVVSATGVRPSFKVLDFGISAFVDGFGLVEPGRLTATDESIGTPAYAAPEQLRGETPTAKTDLYSWGLVALECLTGRPAIHGLSIAELHYLQLSPRELELPPELASHPLGDLLRWVLFKQVERRASDASAVLAQLESLSFEGLAGGSGYFSSDAAISSAARAVPQEAASAVLGGERRLISVLCLRFTIALEECARSKAAAADGTADDLLHEQRRRCQEAIVKAGGQLVSFTGSRAVGVFGFPECHEDDARRAAECAMDIHQSVALQNHALGERFGLRLQVSGGLHTGLVTLRDDEITANHLPGLLVAEASDLADRAKPGEVLVSASSQLPERQDLEFAAAGKAMLATSAQPFAVYRLLGARDRFAPERGARSLFGRDLELAHLEQQLRDAERGEGRCVWFEGEAGIGKSALVHAFCSDFSAKGGRCIRVRCSPELREAALRPILAFVREQFELAAQSSAVAEARLREHLNHLGLDAEAMMPLLCPWLDLPLVDTPPPRFAPPRLRELAIAAFATLVSRLLGHEPAIFVLEDAHWCDATTREWLAEFRSSISERPVLAIVTTRPGFEPLVKSACSADVHVALEGLADADAEALIRHTTGDLELEPSLVAEMLQRAEGVPLFIQELTRYVLSRNIASGGALEIPHTLRALLEARLHQLGSAKRTAQLAAVIGREFDLRLLQRASTRDSGMLLGDVEQLASAGLVTAQRRMAAPRYRFGHALIRAAAYDGLLPEVRAGLHRRVAEVIEAEFAELAAAEPQVMARHWAEAGDTEKALVYAKQASSNLLLRSSYLDLIAHSQTALAWLTAVPDEHSRRRHELDLMLGYLLAAMSARGYAEDFVAALVTRTENLLNAAPDHEEAFSLLFAIGIFHHIRGTDRPRALAVAQQLTTLTETRPQYRVFSVFAWCGLASCHHATGAFDLAEKAVDYVRDIYDRSLHSPMAWQFGYDALVAAAGLRVIMDWTCGRLGRSQQTLRQLETHALELAHPQSSAQVFFISCVLAHCRRDREQLAQASRELATVGKEHRLNVYAAFASLFGALVDNEVVAATDALAELRSCGQTGGTSYQCSLLAEIALASSDAATALEHVEHGIAHAQSSGERFWLPRLLCQRAVLSWRLGRPHEAGAADLELAVEEARQRGMLMFELEATRAQATLVSGAPSYDWEYAGEALDREAIVRALAEFRARGAFPGLATIQGWSSG